MTLDVYVGLFGDDLDAVAHRLDEAFAGVTRTYQGLSLIPARRPILANAKAQAGDLGFGLEPPPRIELGTYALRVRRSGRLS